MPTIVDMRPSANTFRHATLIVIWLVVCLVGLGGCKSNLVKETCMCGTRSISKHIRDYLMDKHERKCQVCGWDKIHPITGEPPLHVHHVDGDATNNSEDNLQLLCPNCHAFTDNYRGRNINK